MIDKTLVGKLVVDLYDCKAAEEKFARFSLHIQRFGIESASYTYIPSILLDTSLDESPIFLHSPQFHENLIEQYITDRFSQQGVTLKAVRNNILQSLEWQECKQGSYLVDLEKNVLVLAENGLPIPDKNHGIGVIGFNLPKSWCSDPENLQTLDLFSQLLHDSIYSCTSTYHEFIPKRLLEMTAKERTVLNFASQGKTMRELGESSEAVSRRFGEGLLLKLRERFGGVTTHELIHYATQLRLI